MNMYDSDMEYAVQGFYYAYCKEYIRRYKIMSAATGLTIVIFGCVCAAMVIVLPHPEAKTQWFCALVFISTTGIRIHKELMHICLDKRPSPRDAMLALCEIMNCDFSFHEEKLLQQIACSLLAPSQRSTLDVVLEAIECPRLAQLRFIQDLRRSL